MFLIIIFNIIIIYFLISLLEWYIHKNLMQIKVIKNIFTSLINKIYFFIYKVHHSTIHLEHHNITQNDGIS